MRIVRSQIFYCKLETRINTKIEIFFIYIILLDNKETFENSCISIRSNIVVIYRNLTLLHLFLINILYCFKATIDFFYIFNIENTILKRAF